MIIAPGRSESCKEDKLGPSRGTPWSTLKELLQVFSPFSSYNFCLFFHCCISILICFLLLYHSFWDWKFTKKSKQSFIQLMVQRVGMPRTSYMGTWLGFPCIITWYRGPCGDIKHTVPPLLEHAISSCQVSTSSLHNLVKPPVLSHCHLNDIIWLN